MTAVKSIKKLNSGEHTLFFTKGGDYSFLDVADEIFSVRPPECNVFFCSWRIGKRDILRVKEMSAAKGVALRLLLDVSMQNLSRRGEWDMMKAEIGSSVWLTKNHAKIFAMSPDWVVVTSANLNRNSRLEVYRISRDREAYEAIKDGLAPFFAKKPAIKRDDSPLINDEFEQFQDESGAFAVDFGEEKERVYLAELIVSTEQLARFFGVTPQAVNAWARNGCPKIGRGKWDLKDVHEWWVENIHAAGSDAPELLKLKAEHLREKIRYDRVKADEAEEKVMPKADFTDAWSWRMSEMKSGLLSLPLRLAPLVAGKTELETRKALENELWQILEKYSRDGKWTPSEGK
jgi:hypothetical protein